MNTLDIGGGNVLSCDGSVVTCLQDGVVSDSIPFKDTYLLDFPKAAVRVALSPESLDKLAGRFVAPVITPSADPPKSKR